MGSDFTITHLVHLQVDHLALSIIKLIHLIPNFYHMPLVERQVEYIRPLADFHIGTVDREHPRRELSCGKTAQTYRAQHGPSDRGDSPATRNGKGRRERGVRESFPVTRSNP